MAVLAVDDASAGIANMTMVAANGGGDSVAAGQPLFTLHAQAPGELAYALAYVQSQPPIVAIDPP